MQKVEEPTEQPVKKPRACPFRHNYDDVVVSDGLCMQERCMLYSRMIKQCAIVDLAITMHNIEKYLMQLLDRRE